MSQSPGLKHIVRDHNDGSATCAVEIHYDLLDERTVVGIKVSRGLVEEEHLGFDNDGPRQGHSLCLAAR